MRGQNVFNWRKVELIWLEDSVTAFEQWSRQWYFSSCCTNIPRRLGVISR